MAEPAKIVKSKDECPIDTVTVFNDRAEVVRTVHATFASPGDFELLIEGLPSSADADSVRVSGTGNVVLREVSFGTHTKLVVPSDESKGTEDGDESVAALRERERALVGEIKGMEVTASELKYGLKLVNAYAERVLKQPPSEAKDATAESMAASMDFSFAVLEKQQAKCSEYNQKVARVAEDIAAKNLDLQVTRAKLAARNAPVQSVSVTSRDVTVLIQAKAAGEVELRLVYMVSNASWTPAYDARIDSTSDRLSLSYYANIRQTTGEDWKNAKLIVSTATPSVGGSAPVLPTRHVGFRKPGQRASVRHSLRAPMRRARAKMDREMLLSDQMDNSLSDSDDDELECAAIESLLPVSQVATAEVKSTGAAATFEIVRRTTVDSDNKPHKVTVAILELLCRFRYYSVPALSTKAYLQCQTTNTSKYTLLPSPQVSVFLNNSFVAKTSIGSVSPNEKFRNFLGVDASVKVTYRPVSNVHTARGMFSKVEAVTHKFVTTVKNTKDVPVTVVVGDMLPVADDSAVKVKLVAPTASEVDAGTDAEKKQQETLKSSPAAIVPVFDHVARHPTSHNLFWTRTVAAGATIEIPFEYVIEHPSGRTIRERKTPGSSHDVGPAFM